jgi:hypothetical protein
MIDDLVVHTSSVALDPELDSSIQFGLSLIYDPLLELDFSSFLDILFSESFSAHHNGMVSDFKDLALTHHG